MSGKFKAFILVGCTASGKTSVAAHIARLTGAWILSADSMLVYRHMDIGTAKPTPDELSGTCTYGINLADPDEHFSTGRWLDAARSVFLQAQKAGKDVIVAGGTGLYVNALLGAIDSEAPTKELRENLEGMLALGGVDALAARAEAIMPGSTATVKLDNPRRVLRLVEMLETQRLKTGQAQASIGRQDIARISQTIAGLCFERDRLVDRIHRRAAAMFSGGILDETKELCQLFPTFANSTAGKGIGYAEALAVIAGEMSLQNAVEKTAIRTRQLAKRQNTWWRHKLHVEWVDGPDTPADVERAATAVMEVWKRNGPTELDF